MTIKNTKSVRFSQKDVKAIQEVADEEGMNFSQIVNKLTSIGMAEFRQMKNYNIRDMSALAEQIPPLERKKIELSIQNNLMLEEIIKHLDGSKDKETIQTIRRSARKILKENFLVS